MRKKNKTIPELRVVFDTSVLYTQVSYDLMRSEVRQLIEMNSKHPDLRISWHLPNIVVDERRYQMQSRAYDFLSTIAKLERLLGHNLNITEAILATRVNEAIEKQLSELGISILEVDTTIIDWKALIYRAVYRHPPFKSGEHEDGFRDALIAETFLQLVKQSPTTPTVCRLAVVTSDELLKEYVTASTKDTKNVRVLSNVSELESLINTLVSEVTEEFVAYWQKKASKFFFEKENNASLYYKEKLGDKIRESYDKELKEVPKEGLLRENGTWWISEPVFVKKERQRIFWITLITVDAKLYKYEWPETTSPALSAIPNIGQLVIPRGIGITGIAGPIGNPPKRVDVATGQSKFEIHWSENITQSKKLTSPRIDEIKFAGTKWEEG